MRRTEETSRTELERDEEARGAELARREVAIVQRERSLLRREEASRSERERNEEERNVELAQHEADLRALETRLAAREADVVRLQAALAAREEELRRRERELDDAERLHERAAAVPLEPHVSFSEGLDSLAGRSERRWS